MRHDDDGNLNDLKVVAITINMKVSITNEDSSEKRDEESDKEMKKINVTRRLTSKMRINMKLSITNEDSSKKRDEESDKGGEKANKQPSLHHQLALTANMVI